MDGVGAHAMIRRDRRWKAFHSSPFSLLRVLCLTLRAASSATRKRLDYSLGVAVDDEHVRAHTAIAARGAKQPGTLSRGGTGIPLPA